MLDQACLEYEYEHKDLTILIAQAKRVRGIVVSHRAESEPGATQRPPAAPRVSPAMPLPRVRFTVRRMMVLAAGVALLASALVWHGKACSGPACARVRGVCREL